MITEKATTKLWICMKFVREKWGAKPKIMHWMYTAIVRTAISYAAIAWWEKTKEATVQKKLNSVQRIACIMITNSFKTTPTSAMETLLDLPPLHLFIKKEAKITNYTFSVDENNLMKSYTCKILDKEQKQDEILNIPISDKMSMKFNFEPKFKVKFPKREEWLNNEITFTESSVVYFTDGSKFNNNTGAGVYGEKGSFKISSSLGDFPTVYQMELYAIILCLERVKTKNIENKKIFIISDSQAALKSLIKTEVTSKLAWDCIYYLNLLAMKNKITLMWVPGHNGILGNEEADTLAKKGTEMIMNGPSPFCGIPIEIAKTRIKEWLRLKTVDEWYKRIDARHSRSFINKPSFERTFNLLKKTRHEVRLLTAYLTGHGPFKHHLKRMGLTENSTCRFCDFDEETAEHILCECEALAHKRNQILGIGFPTSSDYNEIKLDVLLNFLKKINFILGI